MMGPTAGELTWLKREGEKAMPDTVTILRNTPVRIATTSKTLLPTKGRGCD